MINEYKTAAGIPKTTTKITVSARFEDVTRNEHAIWIKYVTQNQIENIKRFDLYLLSAIELVELI